MSSGVPFPHVCLDAARVQAFAAPLIDFPDAFRGGPVLEREEHRIFRHDRGGEPADGVRAGQTYAVELAGSYVYAGPVYDHFGHFMAEMVHRIVPAQLLGLPPRYLFVGSESDGDEASYETLPAFVRDVLDFCGIGREAVVVLTRNAIVERLHIVRQGASLGTYPKPGYLDALAAYSAPRLDRLFPGIERPRRLYVSRSAMPKTGSFLGEARIEAELARAGFAIFHPERHGVTEQMDHYRKAESLVFSGGSACHGVELLGTGMLGNVLLFPRIAYQSYLFRRVLKPRARQFREADVSVYLGSLRRNRTTSTESEHEGVSLFDLDRLAVAGRQADPAFPRRFGLAPYAAQAFADLAGYCSEARRAGDDRSTTRARTLFAGLARHVLAAARGRGAGTCVEGIDANGPRVLAMPEIAEIRAACGTMPVPFDAFFRIAMLTLQQPPHVAGMRWSELSSDGAVWDIPAARTKNGRARRVALTEPVREALAALPRVPGVDRVFVMAGKPIGGIAAAKEALDAAIVAGRAETGGARRTLAPWTLFDLRRTGLQRLEELGYDEAIVRSALGLDAGPHEAASAPAGSETERARVLEAWAREVRKA